jgi:protein-tyrosine phosphatase
LIDLHSHILPGLDDGARSLDDALEIARGAVADGITAIAATPHVRADYPTTADAMESGVRQLRAALERESLELDLLPGGEVSLEQLDRLSHDELRRFGLGGNQRYLLIETPYSNWPLAFRDIVLRLTTENITPVIAHPERNVAVQADIGKVADLVHGGALIQITAASIDGRLGSRARACARKLLAAELVHMVGSDAHTAGVREVGLSTACEAIDDPRLARWLTEHVPAAIVRNAELPARPMPKRKRGFMAYLLGR